ncbi:lipopolysaccharide transport periplasmic protein LptA [Spiribacter sp. 221]|uniref:lipopolysaccharide transport periplasmic protein LptA n=1 Tax=Spiribacter onubensis TaxID=3122420 RepID=UPI00349FCDF1
MRLRNKLLCHVAWISITAVLAVTHAQTPGSPDRGPVELEADSAEVDDASGRSVYKGDVVLTRGSLRITGDVMRAFVDAHRQLQRVVVEGVPATYRETLPDASSRHAEAPRMEYFTSGPERLILLEGARLWQGDNTVTGETITHYPAEDRTVAEGAGGGDGRVNVRVLPAPEGDQ